MIKKLSILMGVGLIAYGTSHINLTNTNAALSAPSSWNIRYRNLNNTGPGPRWALESTSSSVNDPGYVRSGISPNFNYDNGLGGTGWNHDDFPNIIPDGMTINLRFNESNTSWITDGSGMYYPGNFSIGSTGKATTFDNVKIEVNNQTNKDYHLYFDLSSSANVIQTLTIQNGNNLWSIYDAVHYNATDGFLERIMLPAFTYITIRSHASGHSNNNILFDALYLTEIGTSSAYTNGYDDGFDNGIISGYPSGYDDGYDAGYDFGVQDGIPIGYDIGFNDGLDDGLTATPIQSLFGAIFGAIAGIFNIQVLGYITMGSIVLAPIAVALLWFILGIVNGVGGRKQ